MNQEGRTPEQLFKVLLFACGLLSSIAISLAGWVASEVVGLGRDVASISSSRCTSADCSHIRESVSDLRAQLSVIPKEVPPKWFLDKVNAQDLRHTAKSHELERRIEALERAGYRDGTLKSEFQRK